MNPTDIALVAVCVGAMHALTRPPRTGAGVRIAATAYFLIALIATARIIIDLYNTL